MPGSDPEPPVATLSRSRSLAPIVPVYGHGGGIRGGVRVVLWSVVRARRVCGRLRLCLSWPGSPVATWSPVYSVSGGGNRGGVPVVLWSVVRARRVCGRLRLCLSWPGSPVATWRSGGASLASPEGVQQDTSGERARPNQQIPHPFCPRDPQDISGERQKDPTSKPSHPFCPRVHQVIGRHVLLSILPQSPSGMWPASPPVHSAPEPLRCQIGIQWRDSLCASSVQPQCSCRTDHYQEQCCNGGCDARQQQ
ncbi:uncharacterized protein LOC135096340 isoform X2 [Scylla paramamosain]|uniref:uncharacterized protein LOC135096340 isoform X2 n=1 Tax=Scylla paramamosain TaxID=85552 RepID=UPI0030826EA3